MYTKEIQTVKILSSLEFKLEVVFHVKNKNGNYQIFLYFNLIISILNILNSNFGLYYVIKKQIKIKIKIPNFGLIAVELHLT